MYYVYILCVVFLYTVCYAAMYYVYILCVVFPYTVCYAATYVLRVHRKDLSKCVLAEITLLIEDEELSVKVVAVEALVDIVPHVNKGGPQRFTL